MKLHNNWQDVISLTMDSFFLGTGWYEIEKEAQVYYRWSGPEAISTIHLFPQRRQANRLNLIIYAVANNINLSDLRIEAEGIPLQVTTSKKRNPTFLTTVLPADLSKEEGSKTVITFNLPKTLLTKQSNNDSNDNRKLGIALQQIDIFPLARPMFTAQKYQDSKLFDGLNYIRFNPDVRDAVIHGIYASAYEYFIKQNCVKPEEVFELHENFDECPGDLFDILNEDMKSQTRRLEEKYQEEMAFLRYIVYHQGDTIRALKGQNKSQK